TPASISGRCGQWLMRTRPGGAGRFGRLVVAGAFLLPAAHHAPPPQRAGLRGHHGPLVPAARPLDVQDDPVARPPQPVGLGRVGARVRALVRGRPWVGGGRRGRGRAPRGGAGGGGGGRPARCGGAGGGRPPWPPELLLWARGGLRGARAFGYARRRSAVCDS